MHPTDPLQAPRKSETRAFSGARVARARARREDDRRFGQLAFHLP
jgi:hypothetical protein